jgi:hypothetical protein
VTFFIYMYIKVVYGYGQSHICGGATGSHVTGTDVTGSHVTGRFLNRLYDLACSGAVYNCDCYRNVDSLFSANGAKIPV